jgi:hypothetical protein
MKKQTKLKLDIKKPWEIGRGAWSPRSGAGEMGDKRTKRNRTRSAQKRNVFKEE